MEEADGAGLWSRERQRTVVLDGQRFVVRPRATEPGTYDFDWQTGPNPNYGFTSFGWQGRPLTIEEIEDAIRDLLSQIDPETGYIGD